MNRSQRTTSCIFLLAVGLLVQIEFARQKTPKVAKKEQGKVILVLQTRDNLITVRSSRGEHRYSVATLQGIVLAEHLSVNELKHRFPELHEVVQGIAWAGAIEPARSLRKLFPDNLLC